MRRMQTDRQSYCSRLSLLVIQWCYKQATTWLFESQANIYHQPFKGSELLRDWTLVNNCTKGVEVAYIDYYYY